MKISSNTDRLEKRFGAVRAVRMLAEAGFEAVDYSMYTAEGAVFSEGGRALCREMKRVADSLGIVFNQAHAPFATYKPGSEYDAYNRELFFSMRRALEIGAEIGAEAVVVHPAFICPHISRDDRFSMNMEIYSRLLEYAKQLDVKIAIENMYGRHRDCNSKKIKNVCSDSQELIRYLDAFDTPYVTACLDVGHAGLVGEAADEMILSLGSRIGCIHLHDNDFYEDQHTLPYFGSINFPKITRALGKINYTGDVTLEADGFIKTLPDALVSPALAFMAEVARHLRQEI